MIFEPFVKIYVSPANITISNKIENKEHIFDGFEKLAENKIYKLITHKAMIYRLMACEELGYITIIQIKKHVFRKNIGKLEKQLGAKKVNKKLKNVYFVKIKTTKNIKN